MPLISQRRLGFSPTHLLCLLVLLAGLAGCATQPGGGWRRASNDLSSDIQTPSDDTDDRKRARTLPPGNLCRRLF